MYVSFEWRIGEWMNEWMNGWMNEQGYISLYKSIIRPTLEYCNSVWCPMFKRDEGLLEKVQQRATRLLPELRQKTYPDRLFKESTTTYPSL